MTPRYREMARSALASARAELHSGDDNRLVYAALRFRMAIEALTYDRAQSFKEEIPPEEYNTWQPRKLMQLLLDIDPLADQTAIVSIGIQESPGVPAKELRSLGADTVFNLKSIKAHYDALGSYLHMPTLKQLEAQAAPDLHSLRARCVAIESEVQAVLASPIYNVTFAGFATLPCGRCEKPIRRRIPVDAQNVEVECFECGAPYEITRVEGKGLVEWHAKITNFQCIDKSCNTTFPIWRDEVQSGALFKCPKCQARYRLQLYMVSS